MPSALGGHPPLEAAIRHWKRRVPDSDDQRTGKTRARRERARLLLARYIQHGTTQRKWIDSLASSEDLVRWSCVRVKRENIPFKLIQKVYNAHLKCHVAARGDVARAIVSSIRYID